MSKIPKITSLAAAELLLSGLSFGACGTLALGSSLTDARLK
jgi:hypothetical protein